MPISDTNAPTSLSRRDFLARSAAASVLAAGAAGIPQSAHAVDTAAAGRTAFFVVGDTHFLADIAQPAKLDDRSAQVCSRLIDTLNRLPGTAIPEAAGGGEVGRADGLIHAGDVIDTGDKNGRTQQSMQQTEWSAFVEQYGLTGADGRLAMPVYEVFGNHDAPHGTGLAIDKIKQRNKRRPGVVSVSDNGLHYSWDWGPAHFVNLGIIVGGDKSVARKRRYAALDSLDFLVADLRDKVGSSRRPIVITHHIDIARHTGPCDPTAPAGSKEWDPCDVRAFYDALEGFNIAAIFYGHTHARDVFQWDGLSKKAAAGLNVFNVDNSSHFHSRKQAFFYVELDHQNLTVREYNTADAWETGAFTSQVWRRPLTPG
jgi:cytolysin (calcineurin-like family phosphatase)